jgi:RND family efflux transporter MFP subunit
MKKLLIAFAIITILVQSCSNEASENTMNKLAELKKQKEILDSEIEKLEEQLGIIKEEKKVPVEVMTVSKKQFTKFVNMQSVVYSNKSSNVSPKMTGVVTSINVSPGEYVQKGQLLIELDNSMQLRRLEEAKNQFEFIETIYKKQEAIWNKKVGSEIDYLKAKNDFETMKKRISIIEEEIDMLKIKAPYSGIVDNILPKLGEAVSPGMGVVILSSNSDLEVRVEFPENYIGNFKKGDEVLVYFPDLEKDTLTLKISSISQVIDTKNRTMTAIIKVPNELKQVRPNMTCVTKFALYSVEEAIVIPINLVQRDNGREFVYLAKKLDDGTYNTEKRIVKTGVDYNDKVEILFGLKEQDLLITFGANDVSQDTKIEVTQVLENSNY